MNDWIDREQRKGVVDRTILGNWPIQVHIEITKLCFCIAWEKKSNAWKFETIISILSFLWNIHEWKSLYVLQLKIGIAIDWYWVFSAYYCLNCHKHCLWRDDWSRSTKMKLLNMNDKVLIDLKIIIETRK